MTSKPVYVRCKVSRGLFDTEFYVVLSGSSVIVNKTSVKVIHEPDKDAEVDGQVLAYLIEEAKGNLLVELPGQAVVGGLRTWVPKELAASG